MKSLLLASFFAMLMVASCTCNDKADDMDTVATDTLVSMPVTTAPPAVETRSDTVNTGTVAKPSMSDEQYQRMFNVAVHTDATVREYRRVHDERDYGGVPGYYPEGSTRALTDEDTRYLTKWGHSVMLNEIYARHGMRFSDADIQEHFSSFGWYSPKSSNVQAQLTPVEKENISFLNSHPAK